MKHLGDITKINGAKVPVVNIICGGSPCQDLSVAGKRAGLSGERSGLFMDQIRIIKEMRENDRAAGRTDEHIRPRYMVWENVPGAFSSNKGEDFRAVLEETAKVAQRDACIPGFEGGRWPAAGCIMGAGWSIAWRVHDAQFWGVPQRRKRIALVADFGGESASEILFERKSMSGDIEKSGGERQGVTGAVEGSTGETSKCLNGWDVQSKRIFDAEGVSHTLNSGTTEGMNIVPSVMVYGISTSLPASMGMGGGYVPMITDGITQTIGFTNRGFESGDVTETLRSDPHGAYPMVATGVTCLNDQDGMAGTVRANAGDNQQAVVYGISAYESNAMKSSNPHSGIYEAETSRTLDLNGGNPACNQRGMAVVEPIVACYDMDNERRRGPDEIIDKCPAITARAGTGGNNIPVVLEGNGSRPSHKGDGFAESETMYTLNSTERHAVYDARGNGNGQIAPTITGDHQNRITDYTAITYQETTGSLCASGHDKLGTQEALNDMYVVQKQHGFAMQAIGEYKDCESASSLKQRDYKDATDLVVAFTPDSIVKNTDEGVAYSMLSRDYKDPQCVAYGLDRAAFNQGENAKYSFSVDEEKVGTCIAKGPNGVFASVVRRLTPMECERLQGFPDGWTNIGEWVDTKGKKHKDADSPRYKALGNSIAVGYANGKSGFWCWMAGRMVNQLRQAGVDKPTMASLFDGIGGFPLAYSAYGCKPVWASEIEEFPIAVTKIRFPENECEEAQNG